MREIIANAGQSVIQTQRGKGDITAGDRKFLR
jgi:hypothetical protein